MGDNPTHPEYLAMLRCLQERRDEKIRRSTLELQFKLSVLRRRAVAERAQIMSQFYQAVRESRDETVAELGREWYQIQQERRRAANTIPDYGLRFPATRQQAIREAVSYNKEVSVLSGFAKHVGFPAAPSINGATEEQVEADLEAIQVSLSWARLPGQWEVHTNNNNNRVLARQCRDTTRAKCPATAQNIPGAFRRSCRDLEPLANSSLNKHRGQIQTTQPTACSITTIIITRRTAKVTSSPHTPVHRQLQRGNPTSPVRYTHQTHLPFSMVTLRPRYKRRIRRRCQSPRLRGRWALSR